MCLILFAVHPSHPEPGYRLVVAANRDEFYERPSREAMYWSQNSDILAGQDLSMGGTWLGITRSGRFAAVTNFREAPPDPLPTMSRGDLTTGFLNSAAPALSYLQDVASRGDQYRGFNLVLGDSQGFYYLSNRQPGFIELTPGFYGLSNQQLNCDWPKVTRGREQLKSIITTNSDLTASLFTLLSDRGDGTAFSNSFIESTTYGTCAKTVVLWRADGSVEFEERCYVASGRPGSIRHYDFRTGES